jgi:Histidine kinase-like ATPase domain
MATPRQEGRGSPEQGKGTGSDLPPLELRTCSRPGSVTETRRRVAEYAELGGANRDDVELAVAEAVANAVVHAFDGRDDGVITVRAEMVGPDELVVEMRTPASALRR